MNVQDFRDSISAISQALASFKGAANNSEQVREAGWVRNTVKDARAAAEKCQTAKPKDRERLDLLVTEAHRALTAASLEGVPLLSFHFSFGNSTDGPLGICARIWAVTEAEAVQKLHAALAEEISLKTFGMGGHVEYINLYTNTDYIGTDNIDEVNDDPAEDVQGIPADFPVRPLQPGDKAEDKATCLTCGRSWDDAIVTSYTPAPSARCPFEAYHQGDTQDEAPALVRLAQGKGWKAAELAVPLGIHPDRLNNGGLAEVVAVALADDDADWIKEVIESKAD